MIFLVLSILSSCSIFVLFKVIGKYKIDLFLAIIINYITATICGYIINNQQFSLSKIITADWFYVSLIIGVLFIVMFYLIGHSTKKAGITITSISTKMSVVIPILFSIIYYNEPVNSLKITGILFALLSIFMSTYRKNNGTGNFKSFLLPLVLFFGMGIVDSTVKFNQEEYLKSKGVIESTTFVFAVSALIGLTIYLFFSRKKAKLKFNTLITGLSLGIANFGSLYFLILALNTNFLDSSVIFAINNTSIILISALIASFFYKELLSLLNWIGVISSIITIIILSIDYG